MQQNPNPYFSQYVYTRFDYCNNKVFIRILKAYYYSVIKNKPSKLIRLQMLENVKTELREAAAFWLETQGGSKEWREGLE